MGEEFENEKFAELEKEKEILQVQFEIQTFIDNLVEQASLIAILKEEYLTIFDGSNPVAKTSNEAFQY